MPSSNCGLDALSKLAALKSVSAFTLVHLARDNGQNLHVFKVADNKDLVRVIRPAIFHQEDHFVFVKEGEVMPEGKYTGNVIGPVAIGRVVSLAEAKFIKGGKNFLTGKNKDGEQMGHGALGDILTVVATVVTGNPAIGAAVYAGYGSVERAQNQDVLGSPYDPGLIAKDAVTGFAEGAGASGAAQGFAAGGGLSQGIPQAAFNSAKGALQGEVQSFSHPISTSLHGLTLDAGGFAGGLASGTNAFNAATGAVQPAGVSSAGINAGSNAVNAFSGGAGAAGAAPLANTGNFNVTGFSFNPNANFSGANIPNLVNANNSSVVPNSSGITPSSGGGILKTAGDAIGKAVGENPLGAAASAAGALGMFGSQAPTFKGASATQNYATTSQFLGPNALMKPTTDQLTTYINTPIEDLAKSFTGNSTRVSDAINQSYNNQRDQLVHAYAQAGQGLANSSDLQDKVSQLEQKRSTDLSNAALEVQNAGISQAIQVKQQALSSGLQAGEFNQGLAMQLAQLTGDQDTLQYAIAHDDYKAFQQVMGKLISFGIPQSTTNISQK